MKLVAAYPWLCERCSSSPMPIILAQVMMLQVEQLIENHLGKKMSTFSKKLRNERLKSVLVRQCCFNRIGCNKTHYLIAMSTLIPMWHSYWACRNMLKIKTSVLLRQAQDDMNRTFWTAPNIKQSNSVGFSHHGGELIKCGWSHKILGTFESVCQNKL